MIDLDLSTKEADTFVVYLLLFPALLWRAFVTSCLWTWHVAPLGLPLLSWQACLGVMMVRLVAFRSHDRTDALSASEVVAFACLDACCLAIGWSVS